MIKISRDCELIVNIHLFLFIKGVKRVIEGGNLKNIIIDTDGVNDDLIALLFALSSKEINIEGITTISGAVDLPSATKNVLRVLELVKKTEIPVYEGRKTPLLREPVLGPTFHNKDGIGGLNENSPEIKPQEGGAVSFLIRKFLEEESFDLITLGPLTNIATAILAEPKIVKNIDRLITVGGAIKSAGTYTAAVIGSSPRSEYNFYVDPEAAQILLNSEVSIELVGMDVTEKVVLTEEICENLVKENPCPATRFIKRTTTPYISVHREILNIDGCYIADPLAITCLLAPELFYQESLFVQVETQGELTRGETVADFHSFIDKEPNVEACLDVNQQQVLEFLQQTFIN